MRYRLPIGEDDFAQTLWQDIDALDAQIFL